MSIPYAKSFHQMQHSATTSTQVISATRQWVETVVIGHQFCPFAHKVFSEQKIHYHVVNQQQPEPCLQALISQCQQLDTNKTIETTLVIYPNAYAGFQQFLELLGLAEELLVAQGYEGIYQLASFHPHYQFAEANINDAANYTNRSPYPMLHLLRETSVQRAIAEHPDVDSIPQRNINYATALGEKQLADDLKHCSKQ
jgi:hypothetical protein